MIVPFEHSVDYK